MGVYNNIYTEHWRIISWTHCVSMKLVIHPTISACVIKLWGQRAGQGLTVTDCLSAINHRPCPGRPRPSPWPTTFTHPRTAEHTQAEKWAVCTSSHPSGSRSLLLQLNFSKAYQLHRLFLPRYLSSADSAPVLLQPWVSSWLTNVTLLQQYFSSDVSQGSPKLQIRAEEIWTNMTHDSHFSSAGVRAEPVLMMSVRKSSLRRFGTEEQATRPACHFFFFIKGGAVTSSGAKNNLADILRDEMSHYM